MSMVSLKYKPLLYIRQSLLAQAGDLENQAMIDKSEERARLLASRPATLKARVAAVIGRGKLLSAAEVVEALDISRQAITNWKSDERIAKEHFQGLARLSGLPMEWWMPGDGKGLAELVSDDWPFPDIPPKRLLAWKGTKFLEQLQTRIDELLSQQEKANDPPVIRVKKS